MQDSAIQEPGSPAIVVMGVSGCGKSSVAEACARSLGWQLHEGDAYHPVSNIEKMSAGTALTDEDRAGWLDRLAELLEPQSSQSGVVMTCSALRRKYRDRLRAANPRIGFVFLELTFDEALQRVQTRPGHFFSPALVANQFATLESPSGESDVLTLDATQPITELNQQIVTWAKHMGWTHARQDA